MSDDAREVARATDTHLTGAAQSASVDYLRASTDTLIAALSGLDAARLLSRPAADAWSAWDIAYHVAQIEVWYAAKLCEASAPSPPAAMNSFVELWSALRQASLRLAAAIPTERFDQAGLLGGVPTWTPRALLQAMAEHDHDHAAQVRDAVGGYASPEPTGHD